jgi:hypothetical protein
LSLGCPHGCPLSFVYQIKDQEANKIIKTMQKIILIMSKNFSRLFAVYKINPKIKQQ